MADVADSASVLAACWPPPWTELRDICCDPWFEAITDNICFPDREGRATCCVPQRRFKLSAGGTQHRLPTTSAGKDRWQEITRCPSSTRSPCHDLANGERHKVFFGIMTLLMEYYQANALRQYEVPFNAVLHFFEAFRELFCQLGEAKCAVAPGATALHELWLAPVELSDRPVCSIVNDAGRAVGTAGFEHWADLMKLVNWRPCQELQRHREPELFVWKLWDLARAEFDLLGMYALYQNGKPPGKPPVMEFALLTSPLLTPSCALAIDDSKPAFSGEMQRPWLDNTGYFALHLSWKAIFRILSMSGIEMTKFFVNLGAFDGACHSTEEGGYENLDVANCLAYEGWAGVQVEGSDMFRKVQQRYAARPDVHCVGDYVRPGGSLRRALLQAPLCNVGLRPEAEAKQHLRERLRSVDLLKVDVDHADCAFLRALVPWLKPKIVHVEINPLFPPGCPLHALSQTVEERTHHSFSRR
eukprot:TRINITY_DN36306_c0_g1_i4.p1 TRINITY_DN36306_c0_g1~~TRINITY_DN36306_c0_g1_i4.p1  ORF type:complete len:472 (-),score=77.52 TRINITY_DN36306_c0_g1_i4:360-1775(-)